MPLEAKVLLVDRLVDGASNTFRVRLTLPNAHQELPAGLRCKADLGFAAPPELNLPKNSLQVGAR